MKTTIDLDNSGFLNNEDVAVPADLPRPLLWRCIVMPVQPKRMSAGGIALPEAAQDAELHLQYTGKLVAVGPLAGKNERFKSGDDYLWDAKVGDWVVYGRYAGQKVEFRGVRYLIMNDDEILGVADGPDGFRIYAA